MYPVSIFDNLYVSFFSFPPSQVETVGASLDLAHVFLLDAGTDIFIWCGSKSSLMARSKGRLMAEKISKIERKNKLKIHQIRAVRHSLSPPPSMFVHVCLWLISSLSSIFAGD